VETLLPDNATLIERLDLDKTLAIFRIRPDVLPAAADPWFLPGQFVTIGSGAVQRAYSIASDPGERRWLEFYVRYARDPETDTPLTHSLWKLPIGTRLHLGGKMAGRFTLERTLGKGDTRAALLVAAGTGLAPFVSMVRHARRNGDAARLTRLVVLHGVSHPHELAYRDELQDAAARFGLGYVPTISRPAEHAGWEGATGRVESLLDLGRFAELRPDRAVVYVCGFRGTIAAALERLVPLGFVPEDRRVRRQIGIEERAAASLFFEQYDLAPVFDPKDDEALAALREAVRRGGSAPAGDQRR
jgi:ferredoxin/flavodoxin---NADP+ reductase